MAEPVRGLLFSLMTSEELTPVQGSGRGGFGKTFSGIPAVGDLTTKT